MKFSLDPEVIMLIIIISILITYKNLEKLRKLSQLFQYQLLFTWIIKGDLITMNVKPNLSVGIGTSTAVNVI